MLQDQSLSRDSTQECFQNPSDGKTSIFSKKKMTLKYDFEELVHLLLQVVLPSLFWGDIVNTLFG